MGRLLLIVFMLVPLIEIACFVVIGRAIGLWPTLAGVVIMAIAGALILRFQGMAIMAEIRATMARGALPARALADAMMVAIAGLLLLAPGYFTDLVGLLLLVPPVRSAIYGFLGRRMRVVSTASTTAYSRPQDPLPASKGTIDLDESDWRER